MTKIEQTLSTGLIIRQDFRDSVRFIMFDIDIDGWPVDLYPYATEGGTAFIVMYRKRYFAVTCAHVLKGFHGKNLLITEKRFGCYKSPVRSIYFIDDPNGAAIDSDICDVAIIEFCASADATYFNDLAYIIDKNTVGTSDVGHNLFVNGVIKDISQIVGKTVTPMFTLMEFIDLGCHPYDVILRKAKAKYEAITFHRITGISGSPVYNNTNQRLCGMVARGSLDSDGNANIQYIDITDIVHILDAIINGHERADYKKITKIPPFVA